MSEPDHRRRRSGLSRQNPIGSQVTPENSDESNPLYDIIFARFRVATGPLRRFPLVPSRGAAFTFTELAKMAIGPIRNRVDETVKYYKLVSKPDEYELDVSWRETKDCPETAAPTVRVILNTFSSDRDSMSKAVTDIATFANALIEADTTATPFRVDFIEKRLILPITYGPVQNRPDIFQCWDQVRALVAECLEGNRATKGHMTSISLFHYGPDRIYTANPITIFITVDIDSDEVGWSSVVESIGSTLQVSYLPRFDVHIEHNNIFLSAPPFELVPPVGDSDATILEKAEIGNAIIKQDYSTIVNLGDTVGPAKYIDRDDGSKGYAGSGTLGCFVEVRTPAGSWEKYGLTNYHVVRGSIRGFKTKLVRNKSIEVPPADTSPLLKADQKGLAPGAHETLALIESPSRAKHNYTMWDAHKEIERYDSTMQRLRISASTDPNAEAQLATTSRRRAEVFDRAQKKKEFFDKRMNTIGKIYAASGFLYKTPMNGRLDWALIKINKTRVGNNLLPPESAWQGTAGSKRPWLTYGNPLAPQQQTIRDKHPAQCKVGYKYGATTGATCGIFDELRTDIDLVDTRHLGDGKDRFKSSEHTFVINFENAGDSVLARGDSGSILFDEEGCALGLLFTGCQPTSADRQGHAFVTPIEYVFNHIVQSSNGRILEVRIAQHQSL